MRILPLILLGVTVASLASCQTMTPEERRAANERTCASYGFRPRTEGMARCLLDLDLDRRAELRAFRARQDPFLWSPYMYGRPVIIHRH